MEERKKTLEDLAPGQSGTILSIGNKSGTVKRRLVDMGLTPGTEVRVTKIAPLGDPVEVSLRGYELSLRKEDAAYITLAVGAEGEALAQARRKRIGMVQHVPAPERAQQAQIHRPLKVLPGLPLHHDPLRRHAEFPHGDELTVLFLRPGGHAHVAIGFS